MAAEADYTLNVKLDALNITDAKNDRGTELNLNNNGNSNNNNGSSSSIVETNYNNKNNNNNNNNSITYKAQAISMIRDGCTNASGITIAKGTKRIVMASIKDKMQAFQKEGGTLSCNQGGGKNTGLNPYNTTATSSGRMAGGFNNTTTAPTTVDNRTVNRLHVSTSASSNGGCSTYSNNNYGAGGNYLKLNTTINNCNDINNNNNNINIGNSSTNDCNQSLSNHSLYSGRKSNDLPFSATTAASAADNINISIESKSSESSAESSCSSFTGPSSINTSQYSSSVNTSHTSGSMNSSQNSEAGGGSTSLSVGNSYSKKSETLTFGDPRQRQVFEALTGIQNLRRCGDFSDVTIKVKDKEFRCHRSILSNCSQFFHQLLNDQIKHEENQGRDENDQEDISDHKETGIAIDCKDNICNDNNNNNDDNNDNNNNNSSSSSIQNNNNNINVHITTRESKVTPSENPIVVLNGVEPHVFDKVLDFIYCVFDDVISDSTSLELLLAADTFKLANLSQACVAHVADTVSVDNVYDVIRLVDSGCTSLSENKVKIRCHQVFRENFLQLCCKNEFLGLSRSRMISLVADSMLVIKNEIDLMYPLIRWVEARPSERCADLTLMLQLIRFPLMKSEDMDKLLEMAFMKENSLAKALIEESKTYSVNDFPEKMSWPRQNCISRCQFPSRDFIMWTADRDKGLHLYSIIDGLHYKVTTFNEATMDKMGFTFDSTSTVCCYGDRLIFTGGEFNTDLAWSIDSGTGEVSVHAKMPRGRKFHSMVVSRGCVYCMGGQDKRGYTVLDSVDAYIIAKDLWVKVGHMAVAAYNMTAVVSGGAIYMIGGVDHSGQSLRLVQCFAVLRSGLYSAFKIEITNMPPSLLSPRAVSSGLEGTIYIVSGHGEVYRLDVENRCLHHINTLKSLNKTPRFRFGLAHVGGCLVVNGGHQMGHNKHEPVHSVCMDIATKAEVKDYSPLLPADIINTCFYAKLNSGILGYSKLSHPGH